MVQPLGVCTHQRSGEHDCDPLFLTAHIPFYHQSETVYLFAGSCKVVCTSWECVQLDPLIEHSCNRNTPRLLSRWARWAWNEAGLPVEKDTATLDFSYFPHVHLRRCHSAVDRLRCGGSAKEWTKTLDAALKLDFDTAIPGHGLVTTKQEMAKFRDSTVTTRNRIHEMLIAKKTRDEIGKTMQSEFHWGPLQMTRSLDGAIAELQ